MRHNLLTIEGNIGSGKTSLARMIAEQYDGKLILEQFADNPFLPKFYEQQELYAFPLELFFMAERYQQLKVSLQERDLFRQLTVSDYMFTKSLIFAKVTLKEEEFQLYKRLFNIINPQLPEPDLIVYLYASIDRLLENIKKRGRDYEQQISGDYLQRIQETYLDYFRQQQHLKVVVVNISKSDFIWDKHAYYKLLALIDREYPKGLHFEEVSRI